jgi:hypothetical protein
MDKKNLVGIFNTQKKVLGRIVVTIENASNSDYPQCFLVNIKVSKLN